MTVPTIVAVFLGAIVLAVLAFRLHGQWAGTEGRPGAASMAAFVAGWLLAITAVITGVFLLMVLVS